MTQAASIASTISELRTLTRAQFPSVAFAFQPVADDLPDLFAGEAARLSPNAVPKRRAEHRAGRTAARVAMKTLGVAPVAIAKGDLGQPIWPDGLVGAITHTDNLAIAALADRKNVAGLGIDLEHQSRFKPNLTSAIMTKAEIAASVDLGATFTAKEAVYKAAFPLVQKVFGFQDVTIRFTENGRSFEALPETNFFTRFQTGQPFVSGKIFRASDLILAVAELDMKYGR